MKIQETVLTKCWKQPKLVLMELMYTRLIIVLSHFLIFGKVQSLARFLFFFMYLGVLQCM